MTQLLISQLLLIPAIVLSLTKWPKTSISCILASLILGFSALFGLSIDDFYAQERIYNTFVTISEELKSGNQDLVIKAIDETEMNSKTKKMGNLSERIMAAKNRNTQPQKKSNGR